MEKEFIIIRVETDMKENLKMIIVKEKEIFISLMAKDMKVFLKMENL